MVDKCLSPRNRNRTWLIKYYFFFNKRGVILKELGEYLKSVREENGVGIEEASDDLKISVQIQRENYVLIFLLAIIVI